MPVVTPKPFHWNFDLVIFDLDGTLVDSSADIADAVNHALVSVGCKPWPVEEVKTFIGSGTKSLVERALADRMDLFGVAFKTFSARYLEVLNDHTDLYPGTAGVLDLLKDTPMAVMSNKRQKFCDPIIDHLKLRDRFPIVLGGDTPAGKKPEPEPLLFIAKRLGVSPQRAVMIGDSPMDIRAGRSAGMATVGLTAGFGLPEPIREEGPDLVVPTVAALRSVILQSRGI